MCPEDDSASESSTRNFSWSESGRCVWLTTYHPFSTETSRKSGALTYPEPLGPPRPVAGDLYFTLLYFTGTKKVITSHLRNNLPIHQFLFETVFWFSALWEPYLFEGTITTDVYVLKFQRDVIYFLHTLREFRLIYFSVWMLFICCRALRE